MTQVLRTNRVFLYIFLAPIAFFSAVLGYWAQQRSPCYTILGADPIPNPVRVREAVDLQWLIDVKKSGCAGYYTRVLLQEGKWITTTARLPITYGVLPLGINKTHSVAPVIIPAGIEGDVEIYSYMEFEHPGNLIHKIWPVTYAGPKTSIKVIK